MDIYSKFHRKKKIKFVGHGINSFFDRAVEGAAAIAPIFSKLDKKNILDTAEGAVNQILSGENQKKIFKKTASYLGKVLGRRKKMRLKRRILGGMRRRTRGRRRVLRGAGGPAGLYKLNPYYKSHLARKGRRVLRRKRGRRKSSVPAPQRRRRRRRRVGAKSRKSQLRLYRLGLNLGRFKTRRRKTSKRRTKRRKVAKRRTRRRRRVPRKKFDIRNFVKRKRKRTFKKLAGSGTPDLSNSVFNV